MEIAIERVNISATLQDLKDVVLGALRGFQISQQLSTSIEVTLDTQTLAGQYRRGMLKLPTHDIALRFLRVFGGRRPRNALQLRGTSLIFVRLLHRRSPNVPFPPPTTPQERSNKDAILQEIQSLVVPVCTIQFGWECRDGAFSVEYEQFCGGKCNIRFNSFRREFRVTMKEEAEDLIITIHAAQVAWASSTFHITEAKTSFFLCLEYPPAYEQRDRIQLLDSDHPTPLRRRLSCLDDHHGRYAPWVALALRIECEGNQAQILERLCEHAQVRREKFLYPLVNRGLFSAKVQRDYNKWVSGLVWPVAVQVESITRDRLTDLQEMMLLRTDLLGMVEAEGPRFTALFLQQFACNLREVVEQRLATPGTKGHVRDVYLRTRRHFTPSIAELTIEDERMGSFECVHAMVSPTSFRLQGPTPERTNRIIRTYWNHRENFIRISFVDEARLQVQYRFDREVDTKQFIRDRYGKVLEGGITIAGRHFRYFHHSLSGLREHTFWFVREFTETTPAEDIRIVNDQTILSEIGDFWQDDAYDPQLRHCPARLSARVSQALTTTEAAASVEAEEVHFIEDIKDSRGRDFTDGCGTLSRELSLEIRDELVRARPRHPLRAIQCPAGYQIRHAGSKGIVTIDYRLKGRVLCLRPSQIKFSAPHSRQIEVAAAFYKPGRLCLNIDLILLLEGLGINGGYGAIKQLQDAAVDDVSSATESLLAAAKLLDDHGLAQPYRLSTALRRLHDLGMQPPRLGQSYQHLIQYASHHVLRDIKYYARIPAPGYSLPGVADIHGWLEEGQIYAYVVPVDGGDPFYLEGPTMIFRHPPIHPGDIQMVTAIGKPPLGSPFEHEPLANTVVFATQGSRPLPSCLAGGDLDGDSYVVTTYSPLLLNRPHGAYPPAEYPPTEKRTTEHVCNKQDMIDFVIEYMYSDNIGYIRREWRLYASRSKNGIFGGECLKLSKLHGAATDYPKSGIPVPLHQIPRYKGPLPDWYRPEISGPDDATVYQESPRWVGKLYRAIRLPELPEIGVEGRRPDNTRRSHHGSSSLESIMSRIQAVTQADTTLGSPGAVLRKKLASYIDIEHHGMGTLKEICRLFDHYKTTFHVISNDLTLSRARATSTIPLTEYEVVLGTISAPCSQNRRRKNLMSEMRDRTSALCGTVRDGLTRIAESDNEEPLFQWRESLHRAWTAYSYSLVVDGKGAWSFGFLALGEILETMQKMDSYNAMKEET